jgi:hypothetical protein
MIGINQYAASTNSQTKTAKTTEGRSENNRFGSDSRIKPWNKTTLSFPFFYWLAVFVLFLFA